MQLVGQPCCICHQTILFDVDAAACRQCSTIFHRRCIAKADRLCPECRAAYEPPEIHFAYSRLCPDCLRPNDPARDYCVACGGVTRWSTDLEYKKFVAGMRNGSLGCQLFGWLEMGVAGLCGAGF